MDAQVNPLLIDWDTPFGLPPFAAIGPDHFKPAFQRAMQLHRNEISAIASQSQAPTFDNTVAALDAAGRLLGRLEALFQNLSASATSPELQSVQREMAAPLAAHASAMYMDAALFARIDRLHADRAQLDLTPEQRRLLERLHLEFVRSGARLVGPERQRYGHIMERLAELTTEFAQNVLHDEASYVLELHGEPELAGLPDFVRAAARQAAAERGLGAAHAITLSRSLVVPFLTFSECRDLRERAWRAWVGRGANGGEHDNRPVAREILALRAQQARLHGYPCYADYALADTMAGGQARVWALLDEVWTRAKTALEGEREMVVAAMRGHGVDEAVEPWDWRYWAEKVRRARFALDEAELKAYFALPNMVQAVFECASRLFDLKFTARDDLGLYHPDVRAYEVSEVGGRPIGLFLHDNFARASKRSGAWMSALRWQHRNGVRRQ